AAPMLLVRLGVRESRACPEYRDRRHFIRTLRRTLGGFVFLGGIGGWTDICLRRYILDLLMEIQSLLFPSRSAWADRFSHIITGP
ncbi:MAG: hypothetical protein JJU34_18920, partial [Lunatimonas sp.]|uniref:hypothetical protein n=1 Tax=Lunatimonas sp. TaxID=2060141 RepID=UPI00263AE00D